MNKKNNLIYYLILMILTYIILCVLNNISTNQYLLIIIEILYYIFMFLVSIECAYIIGLVEDKNDEEIKLSTKEANTIKFKTDKLREPLHSNKVDKAFGVNYEAKLVKKEDGNIILSERERYGGMYYFGSLISVIMLCGFIAVFIYAFHKNIVMHDQTAILVSIFIIPFTTLLFKFYNDLINDIKEKKQVKKEIKEGKRKKEKLSVSDIFYRISVFSFMGLMIAGFISSVVKDIPETINQLLGLIALIGIIGFLGGIILYVISSIVSFIINKKKH